MKYVYRVAALVVINLVFAIAFKACGAPKPENKIDLNKVVHSSTSQNGNSDADKALQGLQEFESAVDELNK